MEDEKLIRKIAKEKGIKIIKRNSVTLIEPTGDKYTYEDWSKIAKHVNIYNPNKPEIFSPCCAFGSDGTEEVSVKMCDCPIKRQQGKREIELLFNGEEKVEVTTCIYRSTFNAGVPRCEHYLGSKKVKRPDEEYGFLRDKYKVICSAVISEVDMIG